MSSKVEPGANGPQRGAVLTVIPPPAAAGRDGHPALPCGGTRLRLRHRRAVAERKLEAPSLYDEVARLLARRGFSIDRSVVSQFDCKG